ncbi:acyltransferase domain-containing protein, partial [Streptomyces triticirhizae]
AVVARDGADLLRGLAAVGAGASAPGLVTGRVADADAPGPVFVYPGQGAQWTGMARQLLDSSPVFRSRVEECADAMAPHVEWSVLDVLRGAPSAPPLVGTDVVMPALFTVMVSLTALWRSRGVEPAAVVGHSLGEAAAAHAAGALSLEDAALVSVVWGRSLTEVLADRGGMVSVLLPHDAVRAELAPWGEALTVAALNGPNSVTVSGEPGALTELLAALDAKGVRARRVAADFAGHSPQIDLIRDHLVDGLRGITPGPASIPFYSSTTGGRRETTDLDGAFWWHNLRSPILFENAVRALLDAGYRTFVEASAHPVLRMAVQDTLADHRVGGAGLAVGSLRRDRDADEELLTSLAELYVHGQPVNWPAALPPSDEEVVLPEPPAHDTEGDEEEERATAFRRDLDALPEPARLGALEELVRGLVAELLGGGQEVDAGRTFRDLGFDSAVAVQLRNGLCRALGHELPVTVAFAHPTPAALAAHVHGVLYGGEDDGNGGEGAGLRRRRVGGDDEPIAIVGIGCRYPGGVGSPEELWGLVSEGREGISSFPENRG